MNVGERVAAAGSGDREDRAVCTGMLLWLSCHARPKETQSDRLTDGEAADRCVETRDCEVQWRPPSAGFGICWQIPV
jgi:hypothetical protein